MTTVFDGSGMFDVVQKVLDRLAEQRKAVFTHHFDEGELGHPDYFRSLTERDFPFPVKLSCEQEAGLYFAHFEAVRKFKRDCLGHFLKMV